ncbi:MAG: segregation/condensation protein A [Kiritimatiellia bacterium]|jgi:segregation and condensation protein A|nr:segregation/condensation protein A [Kiritimatiellia bacterium]MDP6629956.1 segregation/condensation protein A [Kiritimatiellia bacterium]MDP6810154.1 segregation/condensation protein A [Kiritimatiellia bacterium]MDP7023628.1 segregation/condensation protein A [Kiritimatiellia bacterium]
MTLALQEDYKVDLEVFEGPLDLLLYLIRKDEVDIYDIPIERVTTQYMEYLDLMRMLDLNIAGEFIVMAATLMMIKSRMLLPVEERHDLPEEDEEADPRWELVRQLVEYKKFKDAATLLKDWEVSQENAFLHSGSGVVIEPDEPGLAIKDVNIFDLISAFNEVLKRAAVEDLGEIFAEKFTVAEKIEAILHRVRGGESIMFFELFSSMSSRQEIVCTFLALLELIKIRQIDVLQKERFGDMVIEAAEEAEEAEEEPDMFAGLEQEDSDE